MSTQPPPLRVYVRPDLFPYLIIVTLDVMHETDLDFSTRALATVRPAAGFIELDGPHREEARDLIEKRLMEDHDVESFAIPVAV